MLSLSTIADTFPFLRVVLGVVLDAQSLQHEDSRCPGVPCATIGHCLDPESGQAAEQHVPGLEGMSDVCQRQRVLLRCEGGFRVFGRELRTTRLQPWPSLRLFH